MGRAIVLALARHGYDLAIHYNTSRAEAEETANQVHDCNARCKLFQWDLNDIENIGTWLGDIQKCFPNLQVLVNNASDYHQAVIRNTRPDDFDRQIAVNLRAPFFLTQAFGQQCRSGQIINILDNKIASNQNAYAAYLISKKALAELTKMAAYELAPAIRVNAVAPGVVLPASSRSSAYIDWRIDGIPLRKQGHTDHVTQAIVSILKNEFITGQILTVDGGESVSHTGRHAANYEKPKE